MTKEIPLTQGQVAIVDDWWYEELNQHKWYANWNETVNCFYAVRGFGFRGRQKILMHAVVANTPKGMSTDHINHNTLDNREENVRVCNGMQNSSNRRKQKNNTSGYKGVFRNGNGWRVMIGIEGKIRHFGTYPTPEEAARAYDKAAKQLHGEYACLNFPD